MLLGPKGAMQGNEGSASEFLLFGTTVGRDIVDL